MNACISYCRDDQNGQKCIKMKTMTSYVLCSIIPSTDVIQLTLTEKMTTAQDVETSVTVTNNSPIQDYFHPDDQTQPFFLKSFSLMGKLFKIKILLKDIFL